MSFASQHLEEVVEIARRLDHSMIEKVAAVLADTKSSGGRVFFLGVGGSASNCSHAVNDFRKIAGLECYTPTDNVAELTARINDDGWASTFTGWLKVSRFVARDTIFVLSVGGGDRTRNISPNLVAAVDYAREVGAKIVGVVGREGGHTAQLGDAVVIVPTVNPEAVTPHTEAFQAVVLHLLVVHPLLKAAQTKWESVVK